MGCFDKTTYVDINQRHLKSAYHAAHDLGFDRSKVSHNSVYVVKILQQAGFDGYLVGGCVRDLILGREPKDFDVTTNATPEQVKPLFSRARIIGRRFKIVHVGFGRGREREIIEVATYRDIPRHPPQRSNQKQGNTSGRILDDNAYGTIEADVIRRDFTLNALYYNPLEEQILDFVDGVADAKSRVLKVIGQVDKRFAEDPVRMLRVIRFQAKLDLKVNHQIQSSIIENSGLLTEVPAARLFDEVLKLFHHAAAVNTWKILMQTPLGQHLFPQTVDSIKGESGHKFESLILAALKNTDTRIKQGKPVIAGFLFCVLLWRPFKTEFDKRISIGERRNEAYWSAGEAVFKRQSRTITIPWRVKTPTLEIWEMQWKLENRTPRLVQKILDNRRFRAAYDFLLLRQQVGEVDSTITDWWTHIQNCSPQQQHDMIEKLRHNTSAGKSRRKQPGRPRYKSNRER